MKIVCVVDSITDIKNKINLLYNRFGNNIAFIVKGELLELFKTYGFNANAVYQKNLSKVLHMFLLHSQVESIVIYYTSLKMNNVLLNEFIKKIGKQDKVVNLVPNYNGFEKIGFSVYNVYVKSLFKANDSLISTKLQFLPVEFMTELLSSHVGNRLFEINPLMVHNVYINDDEINKSAKTKTKLNKFHLIPILVALIITLALVITLAFVKINYLLIAIFICLYILDIVLYIIYQCKIMFDSRFLK